MCALLSNKERQFLSPAAFFEPWFDLLAAMFAPLPPHISRKAALDALTVSWAQTDYFCVSLPRKHKKTSITNYRWHMLSSNSIQLSRSQTDQMQEEKGKKHLFIRHQETVCSPAGFCMFHQSTFVLLIGGWLFQSSAFPCFCSNISLSWYLKDSKVMLGNHKQILIHFRGQILLFSLTSGQRSWEMFTLFLFACLFLWILDPYGHPNFVVTSSPPEWLLQSWQRQQSFEKLGGSSSSRRFCRCLPISRRQWHLWPEPNNDQVYI